MTLTELCNKYGTDKGTITKESHNFASFYEADFERIKNQCIMENRTPKILEIGIFDGASLKAYEEYFNYDVEIYGVDVLDKSWYDNERIHTYICNQGDFNKLITYVNDLHIMFDIIIEDGSHYWSHQINNLLGLHMFVRHDTGIYILEDLHTSYIKEYNDLGEENILNSPLFFINFFTLFNKYFTDDVPLTPYYKHFVEHVNNVTVRSNGAKDECNYDRHNVTSIITFR